MKKRFLIISAVLMMLILCMSVVGTERVLADDNAENGETTQQKAVEVGATDYENLTMRVYLNDNTTVLMSTDKRKTWNEMEGTAGTDEKGAFIETDISWASPSSNVEIYFKGNNVKTETSCTLPKQENFKVKFDKVSGDFEFTNGSDATTFWWRKASDYTWTEVPFDKADAKYAEFLTMVESLRFKGAKLVFRTGQVVGSGENSMGRRPSKEVSVSVSKFSSAPSIKLNVVKLTLNTKATMEYTTDISSGNWKSCDKAMGLDQVAPGVFVGGEGGPTATTVYFRVAQTEKKAASLISSITIPAQTAAPSVGASGSEVVCAENTTTGKFEVKFDKASETNMFEYCVITPSKTFELTKAKWKTVKAVKTVTLTRKNAPDGTLIYVRYKGTTENAKKNIELKLPSEYAVFTVQWSPEQSKDKDKDKDKDNKTE